MIKYERPLPPGTKERHLLRIAFLTLLSGFKWHRGAGLQEHERAVSNPEPGVPIVNRAFVLGRQVRCALPCVEEGGVINLDLYVQGLDRLAQGPDAITSPEGNEVYLWLWRLTSHDDPRPRTIRSGAKRSITPVWLVSPLSNVVQSMGENVPDDLIVLA